MSDDYHIVAGSQDWQPVPYGRAQASLDAIAYGGLANAAADNQPEPDVRQVVGQNAQAQYLSPPVLPHAADCLKIL